MCDYCRKSKELNTINDSYIKGKTLIIWNDMHDSSEEIVINNCPMCGSELVNEGEMTTQEKRKFLIGTKKWKKSDFGSCLYSHIYGTRGVDVAYDLETK